MTILTLQPSAATSKDTYISAAATATNYGVTTLLETVSGASARKSLVQFDLSSLPANSIISSALLTLVCTSSAGGDLVVGAHRALTDWFEGDANGGTTTISGSTWNLRNHIGSVAWSGGAGGGAGTDYTTTATDNEDTTVTGSYTWNVTVDVAAFVAGSATNRGWWFVQIGTLLRQWASSDNATSGNRPKLVIDYQVPILGSSSGTSAVTGTLTDPGATIIQPNAAAGLDTGIYQLSPTFNYGTDIVLYAGRNSASLLRGMLAFDLTSIAPGTIVLSATLTLRVHVELNGTDRVVGVHRALTQWYEGVKNGTAPDASQDGSTWNLRNANGSVAWAGGAGGGSGTDFATVATDTQNITTIGIFVNFDVTVDVQDWIDSVATNYGWWVIAADETTNNTYKGFNTSDFTTADYRPKLTLALLDPATDMIGSSSGTASVVGDLFGHTEMRGSAPGIASVTGLLISNAIFGSIAGISTVLGDLSAQTHLSGSSIGQSSVVGDITADADLVGSASGVATVSAFGSFEGQLRGTSSGIAIVIGIGLALALHVVRAEGCFNDPLLYITDGTIKDNGQLNRLDLINPVVGYMLNNWRPTIAQYKEGGTFSDSPHGTGRRLTKRVFGNAIEVFDLKAKSYNQDNLIEFTHALLGWQESAADYWTSDWADTPIYLVAKAARESSPRYAVIHVMSVPELENPYAQPFFNIGHPAHEQLTLRMERGDWTSNPPGQFTCVAISSIRSWTVAGWVGA